jgi:CheY-like chemotaxis protein
MLKVSDTGIGMDKETQSHIFEPFFTTKEKGKGTGLGLSTIYGIIKQCNGYILIDSAPGHGTTFQVIFPRTSEKVTRESIQQVAYDTLKGEENVIVIEDDDAVRELTESFLLHYGYKVLTASSGEEALNICQSFKNNIQLAVVDVVMPGISGKQLSDEILKIYPEIKILFISGYTDESIVQHGILDSQVEFLQKPFSVESLGKKVRQVLDSV